MPRSVKTSTRRSDEVVALTAQVEALQARLEKLESPASANGPSHPSANGGQGGGGNQTRRDLLKLAGAAAAGAAGSIVLGAVPAAATNGSPVILGNSPVNDYPGYAPIQGVGGVATVPDNSVTPPGTKVVSEGVNGFGSGPTGIGTTGESDSGYGVVGGSGGIDIAALGNGRIMMAPPPNSLLASPPSGPPTYLPNDFEMVRDQNGLLYVSISNGKWLPVQFGGLNQSLFSAVSNAQYALTGSNGSTWKDMDATNLKLTITPSFDCVALLTANADLWTAVAGRNQDIAIAVNGAIAGWKESGGFAGTFSPNAAFVQTVVAMAAGTLYTIKIQWKTNKAAAANATIFAGAGNGPYSPTRLTAHLVVNP